MLNVGGLKTMLDFEWWMADSRRRRICVIISPATLTTLVGHLRGGEKNILKTLRAISWRDWTGDFRQDLQNYQDSEDIGADPFAWQMGKAKMPS